LNLKLLADTNCDDTLYKLIKKARIEESIKLECSVKVTEDSVEEGRCTITLLLSDWNSVQKSDQEDILRYLNFSRSKLNYILTENADKISRDTDIIFGIASNIGKIYLDFNGSLVCYESTNKVKYYIPDDKDPNVLNVIIKNQNQNQIIGKHKRMLNKYFYRGYPVYWIGTTNQSKSFYIRPASVALNSLVDFIKLCRSAIGLS
jgi:hypothetical protein